MFSEPSNFRPSTPPATQATYSLPQNQDSTPTPTPILLNLIGSHPLWGHHLWNASPILSDYLNEYSDSLVKDRNILELGAAAGLPSIVASILGASNVIATDYPDAELVDNLVKNLEQNLDGKENESPKGKGKSKAMGYIWGKEVSPLLDQLESNQIDQKVKFDLLLLSDLVFNHQAHEALLKTCDECLPSASSSSETSAPNPTEEQQSEAPQEFSIPSSTPCALVFFTHHRPHLAHKDMAFFELAREKGWKTEEVGRWKMPVSWTEKFGITYGLKVGFELKEEMGKRRTRKIDDWTGRLLSREL